jgi:DNA (cytosine-5)-methyltransferase 1
MKSISLFSGIGGLELADPPESFCEIDEDCRSFLSYKYPNSEIHDDVMTYTPQRASLVLGGWPCQDISVAGLQKGLSGERSGLFFKMVDIAVEAKAHTIIAENVPNLLRLEKGNNFRYVIKSLHEAGFEYVAWRTLNARQFGLPHQRRRVFIVASKQKRVARRLFRRIPSFKGEATNEPESAGFYWTAGIHGINFSVGYSPTLKVGSALSIPSPPAVYFHGNVRRITPPEALLLQGFNPEDFEEVTPKAIYRMTGNAVARPVGLFVAESVNGGDKNQRAPKLVPEVSRQLGLFPDSDSRFEVAKRWPESGMAFGKEEFKFIDDQEIPLSTSLDGIIDMENQTELSVRAASGLLRRLAKSGKPCPPEVHRALTRIAS